MTIDVVEMTGQQIGELRKRQLSERHLSKWLPEYCVRKDTNRIDWTENYLQFIHDGDEVFYLLDINNIEQPLAEEINEVGISEFKDDFSVIKNLPNVQKFAATPHLSLSDHLVFEMFYESSYDDWSGGTDWDVVIYLIGYLDSEKKFIEFTEKSK